jgi:tellurite methyltransferase
LTDGGYDVAYRACPCVWGRGPGSLVRHLVGIVPSVAGWRVLDVGCGEGRNAAYVAARGAEVWATDVSEVAIASALRLWKAQHGVHWSVGSILTAPRYESAFDLVIAYGLLHCLSNRDDVISATRRLQAETKPGGFNVVCAFNARAQDLSAHPDFNPTLLSHESYLSLYDAWDVWVATDEDLHETHPHNNIPHSHSMTRLIARRPSLHDLGATE